MNQAEETTIPALPCVSLEETLPFWQILGYRVTYQQKAPNAYAVVRRGGHELHFFGMKGLNPKEAFSTCLIIMPEVENLHQTFAQSLREAMGRVPVAGLPRISRMKPGQTRFTVTDPAGNSVIYIKRGDADAAAADEYKAPGLTRLQRAVATAARLRDFHLDDAAAAKVLDNALARDEADSPLDRARALVAWAELAAVLGDRPRAQECRAEFEQLTLPEADRERLGRELLGVEELERSLTPPDDKDSLKRKAP
jgi:hypothetical protein